MPAVQVAAAAAAAAQDAQARPASFLFPNMRDGGDVVGSWLEQPVVEAAAHELFHGLEPVELVRVATKLRVMGEDHHGQLLFNVDKFLGLAMGEWLQESGRRERRLRTLFAAGDMAPEDVLSFESFSSAIAEVCAISTPPATATASSTAITTVAATTAATGGRKPVAGSGAAAARGGGGAAAAPHRRRVVTVPEPHMARLYSAALRRVEASSGRSHSEGLQLSAFIDITQPYRMIAFDAGSELDALPCSNPRRVCGLLKEAWKPYEGRIKGLLRTIQQESHTMITTDGTRLVSITDLEEASAQIQKLEVTLRKLVDITHKQNELSVKQAHAKEAQVEMGWHALRTVFEQLTALKRCASLAHLPLTDEFDPEISIESSEGGGGGGGGGV